MPLIRLRNISRVYRTETIETRALDAINLDIQPGEFVSIAGPSGCGKTTLMSILGLLDQPDTGEYLMCGRRTGQLSLAQRARVRNLEIGYVFQSFNLIGDLNVSENVELPLVYRGCLQEERNERVRHALERVGMLPRAGHFPGQLSGGEQQRVALARAIVGDPVLLLADEPTGNLDSRNGAAVMELLRDLHTGGATILIVTHDPRHRAVADRALYLLDGRLAESAAALTKLREVGFEAAASDQ